MRLRCHVCWLFCLLSLVTLRAETVLTKVRIAGMKSMSEEEALSLIGERLEHVRRQPRSESRADDAAFMAQRLFRTNGFTQCRVTWKFFAADSVQLLVEEGPRQLLGKVQVNGVAKKEADTLERLFEVPAQKRGGGFGERPPFLQEDVATGLELMISELHSRGYWAAKAEVSRQEANPSTGRTEITIAVQPGLLHLLAPVRISGASSEGRELSQQLQSFAGRVADTGAVNGLRAAAETFYRQRGFTRAKVSLARELGDGRFVPLLMIEEGRSFQLGRFQYEGLEKTKLERIHRRFSSLEGKTLDNTVLDKRLREMMATGAFESVRLETFERPGGILDATLHFTETDARGYTVSGGFGTFEGPILGVSYYDRNFQGMMMNLSSGFEITARSLLGEVALTDPWMFGSDVKGTARLFMLSGLNEGYTTWRAGGEFLSSWQMSDHYFMDLRAGWAFVNTNEDGIPGNLLGETVYGQPYVRFNQKLDYRDNKVLPNSGWSIEFPIELGSAIGEISTAYMKSELIGSWRKPIGKDGSQIALGARAGVLMASGGNNDLPIDLRYFLGGPRSIRSYPERELGPRSRTGYPIGGEAYWVMNAEYIRPVAGPMKVVGFVDTGTLSRTVNGIGSASPDVAVGLGLRFDLPVGPVRLEYGHNVTQDPGEPSGAWHFAIGIAF